MTTDEKKANVKQVYDIVIDNLVATLDAMRSRSEEVRSIPRNKQTMALIDDLIGHLQTRREKQIAKVK